MRATTTTISAPPFPRSLPWINTEQLRIDKQLGRPLLIAFFDRSRAASLRTMIELEQLHQTYSARGARVIGVHVDGESDPSTREEVLVVVERLGLTMPIVLDDELRIADSYGLRGVPSRYLFDQGLVLVDAHFGIGSIPDTEAVLLALVEHGEAALAARRAEGEAAAVVAPAVPAAEAEVDEACDQGAAVPVAKQPRLLVKPPETSSLPQPPTEPEPFAAPVPGELLAPESRGLYEARAVWLDLVGTGTVSVAGGDTLTIPTDGLYLVIDHGHHALGDLDFVLEGDLVCRSIQLEPGLVSADA